MNSAIYVGSVRHRRMIPVRNDFTYQLYMMCLDLSELESVFAGRWLWSSRGFNAAWFRRADFQKGQPAGSLEEVVRTRVEAATGRRPEGPVRLLTQLRYFGFWMNPVCFYFCHGIDGTSLEAIIAEINNTPWNEQYSYVLDCRRANAADGNVFRFQFKKDFHVSPFMEMNLNYDWRFSALRDRVWVHMENDAGKGVFFDATMNLERREITTGSLAGVLLQYPLITAKVYGAIYYQALKLRLKKCPAFAHPKTVTLIRKPPGMLSPDGGKSITRASK